MGLDRERGRHRLIFVQGNGPTKGVRAPSEWYRGDRPA